MYKKIVKESLFEFAMPTNEMKEKLWYHGTSEESVNKIIEDKAIKPSPNPSKRYMAPVIGRVYITENLEEALSYSNFRTTGYPLKYGSPKLLDRYLYLVIIKGSDLKDVYPDEDIIADILVNVNEPFFKYKWLDELAKRIEPKLYHKYNIMGDYRYGTVLGKRLIPYLSDDEKISLINYGHKLSNTGGIPIYQIWKIPEKLRYELTANPESYKESGKLIYP